MVRLCKGISLFFAAFALNAAVAAGFTQTDAKSAARDPGESYLVYKSRAAILSLHDRAPLGVATAVDSAVSFEGAVLPAATVWPSEDYMLQRFRELRDHRWLQASARPDFPRRSSWLFPDDGCFARAALAIFNLTRWSVTAPSKIFVFGDLTVRTANSPSGFVSWWYHVAPLVEVGGEKYVLDPAIEPRQPLKLADWLSRQSEKPGKLEVAVCGSGSYTPYDACAKSSDGLETEAARDQVWYLDMEWQRLVQLGRDPERELGDSPPWL